MLEIHLPLNYFDTSSSVVHDNNARLRIMSEEGSDTTR